MQSKFLWGTLKHKSPFQQIEILPPWYPQAVDLSHMGSDEDWAGGVFGGAERHQNLPQDSLAKALKNKQLFI